MSGPDITGAGSKSTLAVKVIVESQPRPFASLKVMVAGPGLFQKTFMEGPVEGPVMVPPLTIQEYELPDTGLSTLYCVPVVVQLISGPSITGAGWHICCFPLPLTG